MARTEIDFSCYRVFFTREPSRLDDSRSIINKIKINNDVEGYKKSNWTCYDDPLKSSPAKNAKKCGYGDDVKAYRLSGYKCKN